MPASKSVGLLETYGYGLLSRIAPASDPPPNQLKYISPLSRTVKPEAFDEFAVWKATPEPVVAPTTDSFAYGEDVPMPTFPLLVTMKFVAVEDPMTNWFAAWPAIGLTASVAHGDVVPIPIFPPAVARYAEPDDVNEVVEAYGNMEAVVEVATK